MKTNDIKSLFENLTVWKKDDQRAPHKPLLALYTLGRLRRGGERLISYADVDRELRKLLKEFGPPRKSYHPEYPFWRLQNDGVWEVLGDGGGYRSGGGNLPERPAGARF